MAMTPDTRTAALLAETDFLLGLDASPSVPVTFVTPATSSSPAGIVSAATATPAVAAPRIPAPIEPPSPGGSRADSLDRLRQRHDADCPHCTAATSHTQTVFGEGNPSARLMFVGEAPGETEDRVGRPFVGRAGEKLDEMIRAMGLAREDVYIANVLKSRPPDNRTPLDHEVAACGPYLEEQIRIIRPEVIVTLGGPATKLLLRTDQGITRLRGSWGELAIPTHVPGETLVIPVMPTFHPAYLLRNYTPETRRAVWNDLQHVVRRLAGNRD